MATFKIPESPKFNFLDLNNLQGMDSWDTNPNIMRSTDMLNMVKKEGLHQVRHNVVQKYLVGNYGEIQEDDDQLYPIKYVGKIEEYDDNGNTVPYYIKISEYLGEYQKENDSRLCISVWATPDVKNIQYDMSQMEGFEDYKISYQFIPFTNYGISGNRQGLYEHIQFDGKERVFTPIGILSFNCSTNEITETVDGEPVTYKQLNFEIENVLDNPYIPTIIYGSTPDGLDFTQYESINLLSDKRKAQFIGDGTSTDYQLPETNIDPNYCKIKTMKNDGTFEELTPVTDYSIDGETGIVSFTNPPSLPPIDGKDNVIIEYKKAAPAASSNAVDLTCIAGDELFKNVMHLTKAPLLDDPSKTAIVIACTLSPGTNFDNTKYTLTEIKASLKIANKTYNINFNSTAIDDINNGNTYTHSYAWGLDTALLENNDTWIQTLTATYVKINGGTTTTPVPGSVAQKIAKGVTNYNSSQFNWMGFRISSEAEGFVGTKQDGSDSYWQVKEKVQLWLSNKSYLNCNAGTLYAIVDGKETTLGSTGNMYATSTIYPSSPIVLTKRVNYEVGKTSVSLGARMSFYARINGTVYTNITMTPFTMSLPAITLPHVDTIYSDITLTESDTQSYKETNESDKISYENVVPGSAKLGCYYGAKAVTVYGYESDRRIFVSDGTNKDTYSGVTLNGQSSIYYFPDDNYNVLGEDTEILGYAQKHGYLLTFKRGEDSVYVRYGTTINGDTVFPATAVTRNLQVLSRPIQINDEVLVVTRSGIKSINFISNEVRAELRSYFINNYFELSADYNYDKMSWFVEDNLLHIFLNEYEFTADLVSKSYVREGANFSGSSSASTLDFQYEWYISKYNWIDDRKAPQVVIYQPKDFERQSEGIDYENQRAIGYAPEGIYEFAYDTYKVDRINQVVDGNKGLYIMPIKAHYITSFLNMGAINVAKTIKYVYINTRSKTGDMFAVGYIDENGMTETMEKIYENVNDYTTKQKNSMIPFPKLIQIKSKIRKFMNVKLYIQNRAELDNKDFILPNEEANYGNMTFDRILVQYQISGKYRGE